MIEKIFLIGNPNVGKSVVFSRLTGVKVVVSNYPGTTIGISRGYFALGADKIEVIDLPGTYSLEPSSKAEEVAVSILNEHPKDKFVVINVIDSTNLERNLYLTLQLIEAGYNLIVCLNMCDDMKHRGIDINLERLQEMLYVPVISTCAVTGVGIKHLIEKVQDAKPGVAKGIKREDLWKEIGRIVEEVQRLSHRHHTFRELLEDASVRPLSGFMIALAVLYSSFKAVRFVGETLIDKFFDPLFTNLYQPVVEKINAGLSGNGFLQHLLIGELINGKIDFKQSMGVLTTAPYLELAMVLPYIIAFYIVLSILEDTGFLPRLAILLDNLFHRLGLHGYAIIPVLLGFGCNVPGILATRILESRRERFIASILISIGVPCIALQAMIFGILGGLSGFYVSDVYIVLFVVWLVLGFLLNKLLGGYSPEFIIEIPPYRFPPLDLLSRKISLRIKGFIVEAFPIVLLAVLAVNLLFYFDIFGYITNIFSPVVEGLFGLPKEAVVALSVGFIRKDVAAGLLLPLDLSPKQLFISVVLLSVSFPCVATFVVFLKELGWKALLASIVIMTAVGLSVGAALNFIIR